jgi:tRNA threonylcarbamoyladenosine biosynthesis protein TsaB
MSALILALDTTHEYGSVALARGAATLEEVLLHAPGGFAHIIYGELAALLERNRVGLEEIDCFAAASGPGSFTGVRVGLACVKGLAEAMRKPAVAVSNLQALSTFGSAPLRAPILDARRGEIYGGLYDDAARPVMPETVAKIETWLAALPSGHIELISPDFTDFAAALAGRPMTHAPRAIASAIARLAAARYGRGEACDPAALDANYVRRSDAELFWKG